MKRLQHNQVIFQLNGFIEWWYVFGIFDFIKNDNLELVEQKTWKQYKKKVYSLANGNLDNIPVSFITSVHK